MWTPEGAWSRRKEMSSDVATPTSPLLAFFNQAAPAATASSTARFSLRGAQKGELQHHLDGDIDRADDSRDIFSVIIIKPTAQVPGADADIQLFGPGGD